MFRRCALAVAGAGLIWSADRSYTIMKTFTCDVSDSSLVQPEYKIQRDNVVKDIQKQMDRHENVAVSGLAGTGKTSAVLEAARRRGTGAVYIDAGVDNTAKKIEQKLVSKFSLLSFLRNKESGWEVVDQAAWWYYILNTTFFKLRETLVVIIDHVDNLEPDEILKLSESAVKAFYPAVWLIGVDLYSLPAAFHHCPTRRMEIPPPTADEIMLMFYTILTPAGLAKYSEELLYLVGRNPALACSAAGALLHASKKSSNVPAIDQVREDMLKKMENIEQGNPSFWLKLIEAGSNGVPESNTNSNMVNHGCVTCDGKRLYFRNGLCRDFFIDHHNYKAGSAETRKYNAYAPV